jgi:hypothetical protein
MDEPLDSGEHRQATRLAQETVSERRTEADSRWLPRQRSDFCCLHFVVEDYALSAMLHFERSLDLEVITSGSGRRPLSIDNYAAAPAGTRQIERHLFAAAA